jgi:hypothetical protein
MVFLVIRIVRFGVIRLASCASLATARRRVSRDLCCFLTVGLAFRAIGLVLSKEGMPMSDIALSADVSGVSLSIIVVEYVMW